MLAGTGLIKALSAKSKPTSSSFEIKPREYQRILGETRRLSVTLHCWERRRAQLQELCRKHAIWMVRSKRTHSGAVTRIQAARDICSSPHMPPIIKVLMGSSLRVLQALWSTSYNMSFHVEVMKLGLVSSGWNLNPIQPLTFPSASHSSFLLK